MVKKYVDISQITDDVEMGDISSVLKKYEQLHLLNKAIAKFLKELEDVAKVFMKERKWTTYKDQVSKVYLTFKNKEMRSVDEKMLKVVLNEEQLSKVVKKKNKEVIEIITKDKAENLKRLK